MELSNKIIEEIGYKRINNSMFKLGNITIQNGTISEGDSLMDRILSMKIAFKVCVNGKYHKMVTQLNELMEIEESVGKFEY